MTKSLIDELVIDLSPVKILDFKKLLLISLICFSLILIAVLYFYGLRKDLLSIINNGIFLTKNGSLFIGLVASVFAIDALSRPIEKKSYFIIASPILIFTIITYKIFELSLKSNIIYEIKNIDFGGASACFSVLILGGILVFSLIWNFWLKFTAPMHPKMLGALSGAASGLISSFAYSFHCNMDGILYFIVCYWLPIFALAIIGAFFGNKLKW